jgi:hypothetical protein
MFRVYRSTALVLAPFVAATASRAQTPRLAYHVPAADSVRIIASQQYGTGPSTKYDLYLPHAARGANSLPVVVIFNGGGGAARAQSLNIAWARLLAGIGLAAVTYDGDSTGAAANFDALVRELLRVKSTHAIDTDRFAIWAGSGNAPPAITIASDSVRRMIRALVLYYGAGPSTTFRRDLPIQIVRAGMDQPGLMREIDAFVARALAANVPISVVNHPSGEHPFEQSTSRAGASVVESTLAFLYHMLAANHSADIVAEIPRAEAGAASYAGDWPRAARAFQALSDANPNDAELQRKLADARLAATEFNAAITAYLRSRALGHWRRRDIQIGLISAYAQSGQRDKAFAELDDFPPSWDRVRMVATHPQLAPLRGSLEIAQHLGTSVARLSGEAAVAIQPSPRAGHVMTTAGSAGGVYLLSGQIIDNTPRITDTLWTWTGAEWRVTSNVGPVNRSLPPAAFDSRRGVLVLYGGRSIGAGTRFGDTWEWDGKQWREIAVRTPGVRDHHVMVFDEARGKIVMYGGASDRPGMPNDTWTWDGTKWEMVDSVTGPGGLAHHAMVYDSKRQRVVLWGGFTSANQRIGDVWEWDGVKWTRIPTSGPAPSPRSHHRLAYDAARGVTVMFGGGDRSAETWTWDGTAWRQHSVSGPSGRYMQAMAYDARRQKVVLFGGSGREGVPPYGYLNDTWEWDGERWQRVP